MLAMAAGVLPALIFWGLDAYYLQQERLYRALYDHVRKIDLEPDDRFSLDASQFEKRRAELESNPLPPPSVFWFHIAIATVVVMALAFFSLVSNHGP